MTGSLNEGVELDNELVNKTEEIGKAIDAEVFQEVVPGEIPELNDDVEISSLVTRLKDLGYVKNTIESTGGMNQTLALESHSLVPGLITDACPIEFYSKDTTKTRYNYALESISAEIKQTVSKIVAKIKEYFFKIIDMIRKVYKKFEESKLGYLYRMDNGMLTKLEHDFEKIQGIIKDPKKLAKRIEKLTSMMVKEPSQVDYNAIAEKFCNGINAMRATTGTTPFGKLLYGNDLIWEDYASKAVYARLYVITQTTRQIQRLLSGKATEGDVADFSAAMRKILDRYDGDIQGYISGFEDRVAAAKPMTAEQSSQIPLRVFALRLIDIQKRVWSPNLPESIAELETLLFKFTEFAEKCANGDEDVSVAKIVNSISNTARQVCYLAFWFQKNSLSFATTASHPVESIMQSCNHMATQCLGGEVNEKQIELFISQILR